MHTRVAGRRRARKPPADTTCTGDPFLQQKFSASGARSKVSGELLKAGRDEGSGEHGDFGFVGGWLSREGFVNRPMCISQGHSDSMNMG